MKKYCFLIVVNFFLTHALAQSTKENYYELPLTGTTKPVGIIEEIGVGGSVPMGAQRYTENGIVLTKLRTGFSGFAIDDLEIDLTKAVVIEFSYALATVQGTGYVDKGGMTFFIYDAASKFKMGYHRSALGYAYNESLSTAETASLAGSFLGVGFDLDGGFKGTGLETAYEIREGISQHRLEHAGLTSGVYGAYHNRQITLRGAVQGLYGNDGNPVLYTQYNGSLTPGEQDVSLVTLDYNTGEYNFKQRSKTATFDLFNGGTETKPNFQRIVVQLSPTTDKSALIVNIKAGEKGDETTIIDDFEYKCDFKTYSDENHLYSYHRSIPSRAKIGFTGVTQDFGQIMVIINGVKVNYLNSFTINALKTKMCVSSSRNSKGASLIVEPLKDYEIKPRTFHFLDTKGQELEGYTYATPNGVWDYNADTQKISWRITNGDFDPKSQEILRYVIESQQGIKSEPAMITVEGKSCNAIMNPNIEVKARVRR